MEKENVLGERLRKLREQANLNQKQAATKFGLTNHQLSRYETGKANPDPDLIASFADFYQVTTDYLLGLSDNPHGNSEEIKKYIDDPLTNIAFNDFQSLTEEQKREAIEMIKYIKYKENLKKIEKDK